MFRARNVYRATVSQIRAISSETWTSRSPSSSLSALTRLRIYSRQAEAPLAAVIATTTDKRYIEKDCGEMPKPDKK